MFKGFNVPMAEYEVITPHTGLSFHLRSLSVREEERLKGSLITPAKITEHLNRCIFDAITKRPKEIKDYNDYLMKLSIKDRDSLLYGLYHITYEEVRNYDIRCTECTKMYPVTVQASNTFNIIPYPGDDILSKRITVELPRTEGVSAIVKQPSLMDELTSSKTLSSAPDVSLELGTETLIIDRFIQVREDGTEEVYDERGDIIDAYKSLPAKDKRTIYEAYTENLGKYGIELKMKSYCTHCGFEEIVDIDLIDQFFRMVYVS